MSTPPTLLLADDSLTIQRVVSLTFADQQVRVIVAKDGQDAINRMSRERPDLVLADTNMPCVDGYELARWVRQQPQLSTVPVLLLAGVTDPVDEQRLHDSGANGVLEKPFEPSHVISRVKELLGIKGAPPAAAGRLVTAPDIKPSPAPPRKPGSGPRPAAAAGERQDGVAAPAAPDDGRAAPRAEPVFAAPPSPAPEPSRAPAWDRSADPDELAVPRGAVEDWFSGAATEGASGPLAEELGVSDPRFYGQAEDAGFASERGAAVPPRGAGPSSPADVFESLLAAEQGDSPAPWQFPSAAALTPEVLDELAARVVERLRPKALAEELQRGLGMGLRDAVVHTLRESMAAEVRAAVAEAVQAAVNGTILGTVRGAVNEAVAAAVPAAIEQQVGAQVEHTVRASTDQAVRATIEPVIQESLGAPLTALVRETVAREVRDSVVPALQQVVREVVDVAIRGTVADAVASAVPAAVLDAVRGDGGGQVRSVVRETAERLITEEIARIRERRPA